MGEFRAKIIPGKFKAVYSIIFFHRDERAGILQVDNEAPVGSQSLEGSSQLDTNGMMWIGRVILCYTDLYR